MNAKELREAAYRRWKQAHKELIDYELEDHDDPDLLSHWSDMLEMSNHILATVRDDDDEPVSEEWAASLPAAVHHEPGDSVLFLSGFSLFFGCDNHVNAMLSQSIHLARVKTRGQFRKLCEGLGITLKETT